MPVENVVTFLQIPL